MTRFVELYTGALVRGYKLYGVTAKRVSLFPSSLMRARGNSSFRSFESAGFTRIGLEDASVWNSRHAVGARLSELGIEPMNTAQSSLADSFVIAMNTGARRYPPPPIVL